MSVSEPTEGSEHYAVSQFCQATVDRGIHMNTAIHGSARQIRAPSCQYTACQANQIKTVFENWNLNHILTGRPLW